MFKAILVFGLLGLAASTPVKVGFPTVNVSIYYESLDALSRAFLTGQFNQAIDDFGNFAKFEIVPSGFAQVVYENAVWIRCQNGENECYGNGIAACALNRTDIYSPYNLNHFIACLEGNTNFDQSGKQCSHDFHLNWKEISYCNSYKSDDLLVKTAQETQKVEPLFLPYVTFNHVKDDEVAKNAIVDFHKTLCDHLDNLPPTCRCCV